MLATGLQLTGQDEPSIQPESTYTEAQAQAIDRVDKLSELLLAMPWEPTVVGSLSRLGDVACQHDKELGIRVFETAYSVAAGLDLDLDEESSVHLLSSLLSRASNCHPEFSSRSPTGREDLRRLKPRASLSTTWDAVRTNPAAAAGFAHDVADTFSNLDTWGQRSFVSALTSLRQERPAEADAVFQHALRGVTSSGSVAELFALGNYVFGPPEAEPGSDVVHVMPMPEGTLFGLVETRPGVSEELANLYVASSRTALARQAALAQEDTLAYGLTKQLESWAKSHAPDQVPTLASLLGDQRARLAQTQGFSDLERRIQSFSGDSRIDFEQEIESAPDESTKARLRFHLAYIKISRGDLEVAREIVAELEDQIRAPLLDIIALKEVRRAIREDDLEAARLGLSTLNDKLHLVLAALSLASAHWKLMDDSGNRLEKDSQAAADAIQLAGGATAKIPGDTRPKIRVAIAGALALTERFEESLAALELAVQEFNTAQEPGRSLNEPLSVRVSDSGDVYATVTRENSPRTFNLLRPEGRISNFAGAVLQLLRSPEPDVDRLEGIVTRVANPRLRTSGLLAIAEGVLANAFHPASDPLTEPGNGDEPFEETPASPSADDQEALD